MKIIGVIPARLASTRLPEKVLRPLAGKPMIQHVWERAKEASRLQDVIVACDHPRIAECVESFGGKAVLTRPDHPNGSSRVAEIAGHEAADVFLNIQGDEPLVHPEAINQLAAIFSQDKEVEAATLAVPSTDERLFHDPNVVKVVCDHRGNALYFSRSPIPYNRDRKPAPRFLKHLGLYGYRRRFLLEFVSWAPGPLEIAEKLEQLRILERGHSIRVLETKFDSVGVDTEEDFRRAASQLQSGKEAVRHA